MTEPPAIPRTPDRSVRKDLPVIAWTGSWGTASIQQALDLHDQGQFLQSAQLSETVQRDDRVATALNTRCKGLLGLPREISPSPTGDRRKAKQAARDLAQTWTEGDLTETLVQALRWQILMGFALVELVWTGDAERWTFHLKVWHPQFVWFNWWSRRFMVNTAEGVVEVTPGDGKWFLFAPEGDYRCWVQGAIRSIGIPWLGRQYAFRDWMRFNEVYGLPIRKATVPAQTPEEDKDGFFLDIANAGSSMVVSCPQGTDGQGYNIELVEATATGWETFRNSTEDADRRITLALLGQNLTTEVSGGSYAAAKVHGQVRQDYLEADERGLTSGFRRQVLRAWAQFNYGDPDLAPVVRFDTEPPEDEKARADVLLSLSTALLNLKNTTPDLDERRLLERFGVPLVEVDPDEEQEASQQIFQYHLQFGIVTINEARAALGLPPVPGGDQPPAPLGEGQEPDASPVTTSRRVRASRYDPIDFTPPAGVREEAQRGLDWREEHGRGGTEVGVARARDLSNGRTVSPETARRMKAYFDRHASDRQGEGWSPGEDGFPSAGRIAWALWGGDPGQSWAEKLVRQIEAADEETASRHADHAHAHAHALAVQAPRPAAAAQEIVDDTASLARDRAAAALRPQVDALLSAIRSGASYDAIRKAVAAVSEELDPDALAKISEQTLLLSQLAGRYAVHSLEPHE